jgi:menaquinone-dependent protoporphyrinogen oxidase
MTARVLVAYATVYGSTREVAEVVSAAVHAGGLGVDCQPARQVRGLDPYEAVILGAPLYMFRWHKDAMGFLSRHQQALASRSLAIFALGPFGDDPNGFANARASLDKELLKFPWLKPAAVEMFGGKFDPQALRLPYSLIPALKKMPASDIRDWEAIRGWASDLPGKLVPASPALA